MGILDRKRPKKLSRACCLCLPAGPRLLLGAGLDRLRQLLVTVHLVVSDRQGIVRVFRLALCQRLERRCEPAGAGGGWTLLRDFIANAQSLERLRHAVNGKRDTFPIADRAVDGVAATPTTALPRGSPLPLLARCYRELEDRVIGQVAHGRASGLAETILLVALGRVAPCATQLVAHAVTTVSVDRAHGERLGQSACKLPLDHLTHDALRRGVDGLSRCRDLDCGFVGPGGEGGDHGGHHSQRDKGLVHGKAPGWM